MNPDWNDLVNRMVSGDSKAEDEFCEWFQHWRYIIRRKLRHQMVRGADFEDVAQEACLNAIVAIRRGVVRDPIATPDFVQTIVKREIFAHVERAVRDRVDMNRGHPIESSAQESSEFDWKLEQRKYAAMERAIEMVRVDHEIGIGLLLRDGVGKSNAAGINPASYRNRKYKARQALKKAFDRIMKEA